MISGSKIKVYKNNCEEQQKGIPCTIVQHGIPREKYGNSPFYPWRLEFVRNNRGEALATNTDKTQEIANASERKESQVLNSY